MHFTYRRVNSEPDTTEYLRQGDVLTRTDALLEVLGEYHSHYAKNEENKYFIVLTQSCDLVRNRGGDPCKARYISIAPVRSLALVLDRQIEQLADNDFNANLPVCTFKNRNRLHQFLERLLNNNESDYFYLHKDPALGFPISCCAFLRLPIALRAKEHYSKCLDARLLSLDETFQAKLGWLVGQLFSRVGTMDWPKADLTEHIRDTLDQTAVWLDDRHLRDVKTALKEWQKENSGHTPNQKDIAKIVAEIPNKKEKITTRLQTVLKDTKQIQQLLNSGSITERDIDLIIQKISADPKLTTLFK